MSRAARAAQSQLLAPMPARASLPAVQRRAMTDLNSDLAGPAVPRFAQSLSALPALPKPQRLCAECAAEEEKPRRKPADASLLDDEEKKTSGQGTPVRPSLEVGPANDSYEREADAIAAETLARPAMENAGVISATSETLSPSAQPLRIRRRCSSCGAEEENARARRKPVASRIESSVQRKCAACAEEEKQARKRDKGGEAPASGPPRLAASPSTLTSGGHALPSGTRDFFESRMGRDLSHVRVHEGSEAGRLNAGIDAHAFTYGSHIWLGEGEKADTGFTMAHELAHVLQQTQPGETRARRRGLEASSAMARVQRLSGRGLKAFWMPSNHTGAKNSARSINEATHDLAMEALAGSAKDIILDAPVPGATGGQKNQCNSSGYADFFQSSQGSTVGVIKACGVATPEAGKSQVFLPPGTAIPPRAPNNTQIYHTNPPVKDFPAPLQRNVPKWVTVKPRQPKRNSSNYDHGKERGPTIDAAGEINDLSKAPRNIKVGDMKPGHNINEREAGVTQIENYIDTILNIATLVDTYQRGRGKTDLWNLSGSRSTMKMTSLGSIPSDWDPQSSSTSALTREKNIKLYRSGSPVPVKLGGATPQINGRWVIAPDQKNTGIFTYFLMPDKADLDAALKDPGVDANFTKVNTSLQENVFKDLLATPTAKPQPRRRGTLRRQAASATPLRVRRNGPKGGAKPKDTFDYAKWHQKRYGKSKDDQTSFRGVFFKEFRTDKTKFGKAEATPGQILEYQNDIVQSLKGMGEQFGVTQEVPNFERAKKATDTYRQFDFWASKPAAIMGRLRQIFGRTFIKVWNLAERAKTWIGEKLKKFKFKGSKSAGGLKGVAMKVGASIMKMVGDIMVRKTAQALISCVETGMKRTMDDLIGGSFEQFETKFHEIETFVHQAETKLIGKLETMFDEIIGPIRKDLEKLAGNLKFIGEIVGIIKNSIDLVRLGICVAGGIESFGISCAVAAVDKILSLMDISPTDKIAGAIMQSCEAQEILAKFMAGSEFVKSLPNRIAKTIMGNVRKALPPSLQGVICADADFKVEDFDPKDLECKPGKGGGEGSGSGGATREKGGEGGKAGGDKGGASKGGATGSPGGGNSGGNPGDASSALPITKPKPVPAKLKAQKKENIPVILTQGMPTKDNLVPGQIVKVTMVVLVPVKNGYEPAVIVQEVELKFYSVSEKPNAEGFHVYEVDIVKEFYVEEVNRIIFATTDPKNRAKVSGLP